MSENIDLDKMLDLLAKMDKHEIEEKLKQAQTILNSKDIETNNFKK